MQRLLTFSLVLFLSCAPALYVPTAEQAIRAGIPVEELKQGRKLYVDHCGSCHMLYLPNRFTKEEWTEEVNGMRERVPLTERENQMILQYILAGK